MKIDDLETKPCIGCGFCCIKAPCDAAVRLYGNGITSCPALTWDANNKRHVCYLMMLPGNLGPEYKKELYAGEGCCAGLNSWRREELRDRTIKEKQPLILDKYFQIFLHCFGQQLMSGDIISLTLSQFNNQLIKDGMVKDDAQNLCNIVFHHLREERSSFIKNFMG